MFALRRKAVQTADRVGAVVTRSSTRRHASSEHSHGHDHGHDHHHHSAPVNESLGTQFYVVLAAIPASIAIYKISRPSADGTPSGISKLISSYDSYHEVWKRRNDLHVAMAEQAAFDRNLFESEPGTQHINLRFPEIFNTGSPYNTKSGHRARNLDEVVAHYEKINSEAEAKKVQKVLEAENKS